MPQTALAFHELTFVEEGDEVVVGRRDTGEYVVLPADGARLLSRLVDGEAPDDAAVWFAAEFGEPVDIDEFLETLGELGFLRTDPAEDRTQPKPLRFQRLGRLAFSPIAFACYAVVVVAGLVVMWLHPDLHPSPVQTFFTESLVAVQLGITFGQLPLVFLHEAFHALAGRRLGLPTKLGVSNRLMYIVFETTMNSVMSVPRRLRYLPFLAGMLCDVVELGGLYLVAEFTRGADGALSLVGRIALGFAFTVLMRLAWQFQFYLRTDLYYVLATRLNCYDLHAAGTALVRNRFWRLLGKPHRAVDERQWTERDLRIGRWYGPLAVFGIFVCIAIMAFASIPVVVKYVELVAGRIASGNFDARFVDGVLSLAANATTLTLLIIFSRRKRRAAAARRAGEAG
jgi:hypothetical protein